MLDLTLVKLSNFGMLNQSYGPKALWCCVQVITIPFSAALDEFWISISTECPEHSLRLNKIWQPQLYGNSVLACYLQKTALIQECPNN